jgi:hypothetical protein
LRRIQISSGCGSTFGLAICSTDARQVLLVRAVRTGCEKLNEFGGPKYEALYRPWREQGDCVLGDGPHSPGKQSVGFATYRLDHDYELFRELSKEIPA